MTSAVAFTRLRKEYRRIQQAPPENIEAHPLESNILEWHYCITGPADSPYAGGRYHGRLVFPASYPYKPPAIYMTTPSGRFKTDTRLCLSMSDYHPETWNPLWSVASILSGLLSFMVDTTPTLGSIDTSDAAKHAFAKASMAFNVKNKTFCTLFPTQVAAHQAALATAATAAAEAATLRRRTGGSRDDKSKGDAAGDGDGDGGGANAFDMLVVGALGVTVIFALSFLYT